MLAQIGKDQNGHIFNILQKYDKQEDKVKGWKQHKKHK